MEHLSPRLRAGAGYDARYAHEVVVGDNAPFAGPSNGVPSVLVGDVGAGDSDVGRLNLNPCLLLDFRERGADRPPRRFHVDDVAFLETLTWHSAVRQDVESRRPGLPRNDRAHLCGADVYGC